MGLLILIHSRHAAEHVNALPDYIVEVVILIHSRHAAEHEC